MIKKMRYQFILVTMGCISFIFVLILSVINISMTLSSRNQGYSLLERMAEAPNDRERSRSPENRKETFPSFDDTSESNEGSGDSPPAGHIGGFDAFRIFSVLYDTYGTVKDVFYNENSDLDSAAIEELANDIISSPHLHAKGVSSKYLYIIKETENGRQIFFLDYSLEKNISLRLFWTCLSIGLAGIFFIFILVIFLSRWIVKPVQTAFDKQKQFIADASHELKTPLTIITTNAEVLSGSLPDNKWLNHILAQTNRMGTLIKNLLELAQLDSYSVNDNFSNFDMSKAVNNSALSFESLAYEYGKRYEIDIEEGINLYGNESNIRQLTTILLDNAFKYSNAKGLISISLKQQGEKKILTVENTGIGIPKEDQKRIFERFYRSDFSRSRESGGYGLGLAIAATIVKVHKGHISVKSDEISYTRFSAVFHSSAGK